MINVAINGSQKLGIFGTEMAKEKYYSNLKRWIK